MTIIQKCYIIHQKTSLTLARNSNDAKIKRIFFGEKQSQKTDPAYATKKVDVLPTYTNTKLEWWIPTHTTNQKSELFKSMLNHNGGNIEIGFMQRHE